jgi:hypothetical protein
MPDVTLPAQQDRALIELFRRVERLERRTEQQNRVLVRLLSHVFSYPGDLIVHVESPPWYPEINVFISQIRLATLVAPSSNLLVDININGTLNQTVTLTAGTTSAITYTSIALLHTDYMTTKINSIGTNGANLSVTMVPSVTSLS